MGTRLYVGNLPYDANEDSIKSFFEGAGGRQVTQVKIVTDRDTGRPRGFAFVEVSTEDQAKSAIADLDGQELGGRRIVVNVAREPQRGGGGGGGGGRGGYGGGGGGGGYGGGGGGRGGGGGGRGGGGRGRRRRRRRLLAWRRPRRRQPVLAFLLISHLRSCPP